MPAKKGGKQGTKGSGRDPKAGRKISKNQINTSGRQSVAAGKKKRYDIICEKEFRASELNTKMKQMYLQEKKEYCEAKLMEKRRARRAALEMDEAYANMESDEEDGGVDERTNLEECELGSAVLDEKNKDEKEDSVEESSDEIRSVTMPDTFSSDGTGVTSTVFNFSSKSSAINPTSSTEEPRINHENHDDDDDTDDNDTFQSDEDSDDENIKSAPTTILPVPSVTQLSEREHRLFLKNYFNTFPNRVVSHVTNHDGINIYKNKLAMTKSKRREVSAAEVAANQQLLDQLPYIPDIASYKFYFVQ